MELTALPAAPASAPASAAMEAVDPPLSPEALFELHRTWAVALGRRIVRSGEVRRRLLPGQIENAAQIGLWEAAKRYEPDRARGFRSWAAFRIRGAVADELRAVSIFSSRGGRPLPLRLFFDEDPKQDVAAGLADKSLPTLEEDLLGVEWILDGLPERQQICLWLRYVEGLSVSETAAAAGHSSASVLSEEHRALLLLRRTLAPD